MARWLGRAGGRAREVAEESIVLLKNEGDILPLIVFSLLFGGVLSAIGEKGKPVIAFFEGVNVAVAVFVGVLLGVDVSVGVLEGVKVTVAVFVGVLVAVEVMVAVFVSV